jgi:hypothetical protein
MPKPLSHDEVRNTVQSLVGPGFEVIVSRSEAEHISKLTGQYLERALLHSVLYNLEAHNRPQEKIHFWKKRIAEIDIDLTNKGKEKNEMKYTYSWEKPEDCKKCKDGWMIDYNGVSKYPCNCVKGQEKEKHEHLHEAIKIIPAPMGRRFRKPVSS